MPRFLSLRRTRRRDAGYMFMVILFMLALLLIALAAVAPRIAQQIRRDREEELVHRGTEYARAIKRYYRKFGRYPTRLEEMESANNLRFLRKRYTDPITGGDFRIIRLGEQKVTPRGLFGAPVKAAGGGLPAAVVGNALGGGPSAPSQNAGTPAASISPPAASGPAFGGGPIVGVASTRDQQSIRELQGKNNYKEWEFVYDPRLDVPPGGAGPGGLGPNSPNPLRPVTPVQTGPGSGPR